MLVSRCQHYWKNSPAVEAECPFSDSTKSGMSGGHGSGAAMPKLSQHLPDWVVVFFYQLVPLSRMVQQLSPGTSLSPDYVPKRDTLELRGYTTNVLRLNWGFGSEEQVSTFSCSISHHCVHARKDYGTTSLCQDCGLGISTSKRLPAIWFKPVSISSLVSRCVPINLVSFGRSPSSSA